MPEVLEAVAQRPPRRGLLVDAPVSDGGDARWGLFGVEWMPEGHPTTSEAAGLERVGCGMAAAPFGTDDRPNIEHAYPFGVFAFDYCSAMLYQRDRVGIARRILDAQQSYWIAYEFWNGLIARAETLDNVWLARPGPTVVTTAAVSIERAIALLDERIAGSLTNGEGCIHMTVRLLNLAKQRRAVELDAGKYRTAFGNLVIADGGYSTVRQGVSPTYTPIAGDWIIGTTVPQIFLGEVQSTTWDLPDDWMEAMNVAINDVVVYARRDVLILHEGARLHAAAQVDLAA